MARQRLLTVALAFSVAALAARAEPPHDADPRADTPPQKQNQGKRRGAMSPEFENVRKALEALTPEQRKRFQENFVRWSNMPPEAKKALRDRDEFRRKKMAEDIEAAVRESGLVLDKERREHFAKRYAQERRKIEEQLRREMDEKRRPLVKDIVAKLKIEFTEAAASPAAATENSASQNSGPANR
jgi:hypothetical protein